MGMKDCGHELVILSAPGGVQIRSKVCHLPLGHQGLHSDGLARWYNADSHDKSLEARFKALKAEQ